MTVAAADQAPAPRPGRLVGPTLCTITRREALGMT
jgi:hypothetical protein